MPQLTLLPDTIKIDVSKNSSLVEVCEEESFEVVFGCRQGVCGSCKIQVIGPHRGLSEITEEERSFLSNEEVSNGVRLACQCLITGDTTIKRSDF